MRVKSFYAKPVSLITKDGKQLVILNSEADTAGHADLKIYSEKNGSLLYEQDIAINSGKYKTDILLPCIKEDTDVRFSLFSKSGEELYSTVILWKKPREWTFYVMLSSHIDIGLHEPPYFQRKLCSDILEAAADLHDKTADSPDETKYRYTAEGRWFWESYPFEKGTDEAKEKVEKYIKKDASQKCLIFYLLKIFHTILKNEYYLS